jgi:hypothetical protein
MRIFSSFSVLVSLHREQCTFIECLTARSVCLSLSLSLSLTHSLTFHLFLRPSSCPTLSYSTEGKCAILYSQRASRAVALCPKHVSSFRPMRKLLALFSPSRVLKSSAIEIHRSTVIIECLAMSENPEWGQCRIFKFSFFSGLLLFFTYFLFSVRLNFPFSFIFYLLCLNLDFRLTDLPVLFDFYMEEPQ